MLCPEGAQFENEIDEKEDDEIYGRTPKKTPTEESSGLDVMSSFKNLKTWKKSISNFFRNQIRSTKSNDGDCPSGSKDNFEEKEISPEQKWQSLGKIFKRQSFAEYLPKSEEPSTHKRLAVRKVLSSYFGKAQKVPPIDKEEE